MAPKSKSAFYAENPVHPTRCRPRRCLIDGANSAAVLPGAAEARTGGQTCTLQTARGPHTAPRGRRQGRGPDLGPRRVRVQTGDGAWPLPGALRVGEQLLSGSV